MHRRFNIESYIDRTCGRKIEGLKLREAATEDEEVAQSWEKLTWKFSVWDAKVSCSQKLTSSYFISPKSVESPPNGFGLWRGNKWVFRISLKAMVIWSSFCISHMSPAPKNHSFCLLSFNSHLSLSLIKSNLEPCKVRGSGICTSQV